MQFGLFERFDSAEGHAVLVGFQHDSYAFGPVEPENPGKGVHDMIHGVLVVVME